MENENERIYFNLDDKEIERFTKLLEAKPHWFSGNIYRDCKTNRYVVDESKLKLLICFFGAENISKENLISRLSLEVVDKIYSYEVMTERSLTFWKEKQIFRSYYEEITYRLRDLRSKFDNLKQIDVDIPDCAFWLGCLLERIGRIILNYSEASRNEVERFLDGDGLMPLYKVRDFLKAKNFLDITFFGETSF